jgi:hypothetical protein
MATFPDPDTTTVRPSSDWPLARSISSVKNTVP